MAEVFAASVMAAQSLSQLPPLRRFKGFESRNLIVKQIIEALKDDDINLIGVCGMGGVGKTTLVKQVAKRVEEEKKLFNKVAMAVVSQEPNLLQVQNCIAEMLGLHLGMDSPMVRATRLHHRLLQNNDKILVILDDIWKEYDLEQWGFPLEGGNSKSCKILFTSRNRNLWKGIQNIRYIQLEVLVGEEPWHLFREKVGNCAHDPDLLPLAKDIVNECGGLPLALVTIGRALTNEHGQHHWKNALQQLRTPCSESLSSEVPAQVYQALYFSYNFLKDERAKKLFLLCCLFPEDCNIAIEDLVRYGIGLRWFEGIDKVDDVRDPVEVLVDQLKCCYLLLDGDFEDRIKMHRVVRNLAISIAAKDKHGFMTIHGAKSREWPKKATYELNTSISVISNEIVEFPGGLRCSKLEFLLIQCRNSALTIPSNFFEGMGELKVLDLEITKDIPLLPSSLQFLSNLLTLHLDQCQEFNNISVIGKLLNLEILSFRKSNIGELPEQIGGLVNLKLLDLTRCRKLKRIAPGVISALFQLQELYMGGCGIIWEREGKEGGENASLREFESLSDLNTLEINIQDALCLPRIPLFSKLTKYAIFIGYDSNNTFAEESIKRFRKLLSLKLYDKCTIPLECGGINSLLKSTAFLHLHLSGKGLEVAVQELFREGVEGFQHLKELVISDCDTLECPVNLPPIFPILEKLQLGNLPKSRKIYHCQLPTGSFGKLKHLEIKNCDRMEEVIWKEKGEDETNKMEFPALESMTLWRLPMPIGFCRGTDEIEFPQLKKLRLQELPQLKWLFLNSSNSFSESMENHNGTFLSLFPHKVALPSLEELQLKDLDNLEGLGHIPISVGSFSKLRKVQAEHCGKLLCVFPSQFLTRLRNLEDLTIENCSLLEKVFELEMVDCKEQESEMPLLLKSLKLKHLPQLVCISKRDPIGFTYISQLSILHVHDCDNLRYLFPHSMMKCMLQLQELDIRRCKMMSRIVADEKGQGQSSVDKIEFIQLKILRLYDLPNLVSFFPKVISTSATSIEHLQSVTRTLFNEKVPFPTLEELLISGVPNITEIWGMQFPSKRKINCFEKLMNTVQSVLPRLQNQRKLSENAREKAMAQEKKRNADVIVFPQLRTVRLDNLQNLETFCRTGRSETQTLFNHQIACPELRVLAIGWVPNITDVWDKKLHPTGSFCRLREVRIEGCDKLVNVILSNMLPRLQNLTDLSVQYCPMVEEILSEKGEEKADAEAEENIILFPQLKTLELGSLENLKSFCTSRLAAQHFFKYPAAFAALEELHVCNLPNITKIWGKQLLPVPKADAQSFEQLAVVNATWCEKLVNVIPSSMFPRLKNLKSIFVKGCPEIEVIVSKKANATVNRNIICFPELSSLSIDKLYNLKSFCSSSPSSEEQPLFNDQVVFPVLEDLFINKVQNITNIWDKLHSRQSFCFLKRMMIEDCEKLVNVVPSYMLPQLRNLEVLNVYSCLKMLAIVSKEEGKEKDDGNTIFFPELTTLNLKSLDNLKTFNTQPFLNHQTALPKLKNLCLDQYLQQRLLKGKECVIMNDDKEIEQDKQRLLKGKECEIMNENDDMETEQDKRRRLKGKEFRNYE